MKIVVLFNMFNCLNMDEIFFFVFKGVINNYILVSGILV